MIKINDVEILTVLEGVVLGGSKDNTVKTLNFQFLYNPLKKDIPQYNLANGSKVVYEENGQLLFQGYIEKMVYNTDEDIINVFCVDLISHLVRSKCVGRYRGTLNQLAAKICGAFGLKSGINVNNYHVHNIVSTGDLTYYDVLFIACSSMFENFQLYIDGTTLKLAEHTSQGTFKIGENIRSSSYSQDLSKMVNKVIIIDKDGNIIKPISDNKLINAFGLFQEVYNYSKECKNNLAKAQSMIKPVENTAVIVTNNDNNCISGRYIKVLEPVNNYMGFFEIQKDIHTIGADSFMELEIKFIYDTKETEGVERL